MAVLSAADLISQFNRVMDSSDDDIRRMWNTNGDPSDTSNDDVNYIRSLSSKSSTELREESHSLQSSRFSLNRRLESSLISADRLVVPSIESSEEIIFGDVARIHETIASWTVLTPQLPTLHFLRDEKSSLKALMDRLSGLQEFIDAPQLIRDCIARSHFSDAWSLLDFGQKTVRRYALDGIPFFAELSVEFAKTRELLVQGLEETLSTKSLRVQETNNLLLIYRMMFPKSDLKEKFVECRATFYRNRKNVILKGSIISKVLKDITEHVRVHLAEIVSQYRAIFSSNKQELTHSLNRFVVQEVSSFIELLNNSLPKIPQDIAFQTLLDVFHTANHIKVLDVNPQLNEICHRFIDARTRKICEDAFAVFKTELSCYNWKPFTSLIPENVPEDNKIIQLTRNKPLAVLYNDIIVLLNDVRLFPLKSIEESVVRSIDALVSSCLDSLFSFPSAPAGELAVATRNMCTILVPTLEQYLSAVFLRTVVLENTRADSRFPRERVEPKNPPPTVSNAMIQSSAVNADLFADSSPKQESPPE